MKNLKAALAGISLAALTGCSSEIDVIREGRLELLPEYTVGQALESRKLCDSTDWTIIEDERGRDIVRYTCEFKDIEKNYRDTANEMIDAAKNDSRPVTLQERLNDLESEIARQKQLLKKAQDHIDSGKSWTETKTENGSTYTVWRRVKQQSLTDIENHEREVRNIKNQISMVEKENQESLSLAQETLDKYKGARAFETIDWVVMEDGSFMVLSGSMHHTNIFKDTIEETPHENIQSALYLIYNENFDTLFAYKDALQQIAEL